MENEDVSGLVPGEMRPIVKTMALKDIAEDKALEVLEGALRQLLHEVSKNHNTTSRSVFSTFNKKRFLVKFDEIRDYVDCNFGGECS